MGLDSVELVLAAEEEFALEINDAAAEVMATPRDMIDYIAKQRPDRARTDIAVRVREIILEELGIDEAMYHEDARFIEDLGVD